MSGMQRIIIRCMEALSWLVQRHVFVRATFLGLFILPALLASPSLADGSKELVRKGGFRPFLEAGLHRTTAGINRLNTFFVYARAGERLQLGSSAMGVYEGDILFTRPNGSSGSCVELRPSGNADWGVIASIDEEMAGPSPNAGGYTPCELAVDAGTEGLWKIVFMGPAPESWKFSNALPANAAWVQEPDVYTVAAWDVSVRNSSNSLITGRVYAQHLPLTMGDVENPLSAELFVLTKDGYQYRVDFNDVAGHSLLLFANGAGFQNAVTATPLYSSLALDPINTLNGGLPEQVSLLDPLGEDQEANATHKLFFSQPSADLPVAAMHGTELVWLANTPVTPVSVDNLKYTGSVGKTGSFSFTASGVGRYVLSIDLNQNGVWGDDIDVVIAGMAKAGDNIATWNGLDKNGAAVLGSEFGFNARVVAVAGEMHLPMIDFENQVHGLSVERLNGAGAPDFTVYYNDSALGSRAGKPEPVNGLGGRDSRIGAHAFDEEFGDGLGVDTWTYVTSAPEIVAAPLFALSNDLRLSVDLATQTPSSDQPFVATVGLANDGPDDAYGMRARFYLPEGFEIDDASATVGSYAAGNVDGEHIWEIDALPNGSEAFFEVTLRAPESGAFTLLGEVIAHAGKDPDSNPNNFDDRFADQSQEDDAVVVPVYIDPTPSIGVAQRLVSLAGDLTGFTAEFEVAVENIGNTPLTDVQVIENLTARFHGTDFRVTEASALPPLVINNSFDGDLDANLLESTQSKLEIGEQTTINFTVEVTPFGNLGPYEGNAHAFAEGILGTVVEDLSNEGLVVDENQDGDASDSGEDDPTKLMFPKNAAIGLAMEALNISGSPSSFSADYKLIVENLGNVPLSNVQVINDLGGLFGPGNTTVTNLSVSSPLVANQGFNGQDDDNMLNGASSTLGIGGKATITFSLQATPAFSLGYFNQVAQATATTPDEGQVFDVSDAGDEPDANQNGLANDAGEDDLTVISFENQPSIGTTLFTNRVTGDLGGFSIYYELKVKNLGDVRLTGVQVLEDLANIFEGTDFSVSDLTASAPLIVNPDFDGVTDKNLLARTINALDPLAESTVTFTVHVSPVDNFGPYVNSAVAYGDSPNGATTSDNSDHNTTIDPDNDGNGNESGENDPTITAFAPTGHLGAALGVASVSGDLSGFNLVYSVVAENLGDVPLSELVLTQDLATALAGTQYEVVRVTPAAPFEANPLFDGENYKEILSPAIGVLDIGEQTKVDIELRIVPIDNFGPYEFASTANASTPFGSNLSDQSTNGLDPDPNNNGNPKDINEDLPSVIAVDEMPVLGLSMAASNMQGDPKGFDARYVFRLENMGDVPLQNVSISSDLASAFDGTSFEVVQQRVRGALVVNEQFDGVAEQNVLDASQSEMAPGDTAWIEVDIRVLPVSNAGPYTLSAVASGTGPNGTIITDISNDGFEPDTNDNGIPNESDDNQPTLVSLGAAPAVGAAKMLTGIEELPNGFAAQFDVIVKNTGDVPVSSVQVEDNLAAAFPSGSVTVVDLAIAGDNGIAVNASFNGTSDTGLLASSSSSLLPGQEVVISYSIAVTGIGNASVFDTQAIASATAPDGSRLEDQSNDGADPDPNGNGNPADAGEDTVTKVYPSFEPSFSVHTQLDEIVGDTTNFEVQYAFFIQNTGSVALEALNVDLPLTQVFPGASVEILDVWVVAGEDLAINAAYDGKGTNALLGAAGGSLKPGASGKIKLRLSVQPGSDQGPFRGQVEAVGASLQNEMIYGTAFLPPVRVATSTGEEAGLESNGNLASLVSARNYQQQHLQWIAADKGVVSPLFANAGTDAVEGNGSLTNQDVLDLVPTEGPGGSASIVTTPGDLFGITNATSVLAVDYVEQDERLAALFATTTPVDELYDHSKNICDRLKGATLESVELIAIKGHPFILSVLAHDNGEIDYAISFVGFRSGANYLVDSRFVREAYQTRVGVTGEILNFQVWSYNPAYTIALVEDVLDAMDDVGGIDYVSQEEDIPRIPNMYVQRGSYRAGQLTFNLRKPAGITEFRFQGEVSSVEDGEKTFFERIVPVTNTDADETEVQVVLPSGILFDALLTVSNDANDNVDQVYLADGPWGKVEDNQDGTEIDLFDVLEQGAFDPSDGQYVVERGVEMQGNIADSLVLFRHFRPGGRSIDLSSFKYVSFTASGQGTVRLRLEEAGEIADFFAKDIELESTPQSYTIFFEELAKQNGQPGFKGFSTSALSFLFENNGSNPQYAALRVENIMFGQGQPTNTESNGLIPDVYSLSQNYPNPFNPSTTIAFGLPEPADVTIHVFDMLGRRVMTVAEQEYAAGRHKVVLDASQLASGAYVYRMVANEEVFTKVMTVVK